MSTVQSAYPNFHDQWLDGQIADTASCDVDSRIAEGAIAFGRAVRAGTAHTAGNRSSQSRDTVVQGIGAGNTGPGTFRGIALIDQRVPATAGEAYPSGEVASIIWRGDVAVKVSAAVSAGDDVVVATEASGAGAAAEEIGQLSSKAADTTHIALPTTRARFITAAAAQGIAVVRLR